MNSKLLLYSAAIFILLMLLPVGCSSPVIDDGDSPHGPVAYLQVTRAQGTSESLNRDTDDFEDRVHDLALLAFDSSTGAKVGEYYVEGIGVSQTDFTFTVQLTPGTRDLYLVANMREQHVTLKGVTSRGGINGMDDFMDNLVELVPALYLGATTDKGFPMSRVYTDQTIDGGGTLYNPIPFRPNGTEDAVKLIRVVAKLEVNLAGTDLGVKNIWFRNANRKFSLKDPAAVETPGRTYFNDNSVNAPLKKINNASYIYYMPESMIASATWNDNGSADNKPINYFTIETESGTKYDIPIITYEVSGVRDIRDGTYLDKAKGKNGFTPNYSIYRNRNYVYTIKNLQQIEVIYEVDPWNVVNKVLYMGYGYYVEVDEDGGVTITNTVDACAPHTVTLEAVGGASFIDPAGTERVFDNPAPGVSSPEYKLANMPSTGDFLKVYYNKDEGNTEAVHIFKKE